VGGGAVAQDALGRYWQCSTVQVTPAPMRRTHTRAHAPIPAPMRARGCELRRGRLLAGHALSVPLTEEESEDREGERARWRSMVLDGALGGWGGGGAPSRGERSMAPPDIHLTALSLFPPLFVSLFHVNIPSSVRQSTIISALPMLVHWIS
jgi:hypothetical protein